MERKITITIEDEFTNQKMSGSCSLSSVNELYTKHGLNGLTQLALAINGELNTLLSQKFVILLPNEINSKNL